MTKVCFLVPAYNCAATIEEVCRRIPLQGPEDEIVVVDDASSDSTFDIAKALPRVHLERNPVNLGYGGTSHRLNQIALARGAAFTLNLHGDLGHRPEDAPAVLEAIKRGGHDIVVGSRLAFIREGLARRGPLGILDPEVRSGMPLHRLIGHLALTAFQNRCFGTNLHCFHEGMRACTRAVIEWAAKQELSQWYNYDTDFLVLAHRAGFRIGEVPVRPLYDTRTRSAAPPIRYGLRTVRHALSRRRRGP